MPRVFNLRILHQFLDGQGLKVAKFDKVLGNGFINAFNDVSLVPAFHVFQYAVFQHRTSQWGQGLAAPGQSSNLGQILQSLDGFAKDQLAIGVDLRCDIGVVGRQRGLALIRGRNRDGPIGKQVVV